MCFITESCGSETAVLKEVNLRLLGRTYCAQDDEEALALGLISITSY